MKRILIGLAAMASLAAASAPAQAAESDIYGVYNTLCQGTGGQADKTLAAADAAGWAPIPEKFLNSVESMTLKSGGARAMVINRKLMMVLAGRGAMGSDGEADLCAVISFAPEAAEARRDVRALAGIEPMKDAPADLKGISIWGYVEGPKGREFLPDLNGRKAMKAMSEGRLTMLMAGDQEGMTMIMQMRLEMPE